LKDGSKIDLFREGAPLSWEKPASVSGTFPNFRWRKYMMNLWQKPNAFHRPLYAKYLCRKWNETHSGAQQLETVDLYYMLEWTQPNFGALKVEPHFLWNERCDTPPQVRG
jgi:hypothetical protein